MKVNNLNESDKEFDDETRYYTKSLSKILVRINIRN